MQKQVLQMSGLYIEYKTLYKTSVETFSGSMEGCIPNYRSKVNAKNVYLTPEAIRKKDLKNKLLRKYKRTSSLYNFQCYKSFKMNCKHSQECLDKILNRK